MKFRSLLFFFISAIAPLISQAQTPCLFNPSTDTYQLCHHLTASGQCAHFGANCDSAEQGMYNPDTNANQECAHVTADGSCAHYGAPTGESGQCMFNKDTEAYQTCMHVTADGQCAHFGSPCNDQQTVSELTGLPGFIFGI